MRLETLNRPDSRLVSREASKATSLALAAIIATGGSAVASSPEDNLTEQNDTLFPNSELFLNLPLNLNDPKVIFENSRIMVGNSDFAQEEETDLPEDPEVEVDLKVGENRKYKKNLFHPRGFSYQDPNMTTCGPVSVEIALNLTALEGKKSKGFDYTVNTSYENELRLRSYARSHDALYNGGVGTDPLGIVKTINKFGWNGKRVYKIFAYNKFNKAVKHIVRSIARHGKPAIIAGWGGAHAQDISGYEVYGKNPKQSNNFKVKAVYLTSPLRSDGQINKRIPIKQFKNGAWNEAFVRYNQGDSPYDNPLTPKRRPASDEWDGKFVEIVATQ